MNDLKQETWITLLTNSLYYYLHYVFIVIDEDSYRLIVLLNNRKLCDKTYKTLEDAKTEFYSVFHHRLGKIVIEDKWSHEYHPDAKWLTNKLNKKPAPMPTRNKKKVL
jgi:hypothetical protein